jgi:fermentation-respiration switch protein FrsA (DUF1100 family)
MKLIIIITALIIVTGATAYTQNKFQPQNQSKMENDMVIQSIKNLFAGADERNWQKVQSVMAKTVLLDYTSMTGGSPSIQAPEQITDAWAAFLPGFDKTHHQLSGFEIKLNGNTANVHYTGKAEHLIGNEVWTVEGNYDTELRKENSNWLVTKHKFNFTRQSGNTNLPGMATKIIQQKKSITMKKVQFQSEGLTLTGNMYFPENFDAPKKYPALVVAGSWTTVKEQMAGLYAERLAKEGFITLAFDFRNYGESEGQPRFYENPALKKVDVKNAVTFLSNHSQVNPEAIGVFGVCAGAMYTLMAAAQDHRIKAVVTTASWLHDSEAVKLFYGGEEGVQRRINAGLASKKKFAETGVVDYVPTISETDPAAAMYGAYDYYLNPKRGAVPQWSADKFAVMSWVDWLTTNPMPSAKKLTAPTLMIHSDGAVLPQYTKSYFEDIATTNKKLLWMKTGLQSPFHQFNFYDQEPEVSEVVFEAAKWFTTNL